MFKSLDMCRTLMPGRGGQRGSISDPTKDIQGFSVIRCHSCVFTFDMSFAGGGGGRAGGGGVSTRHVA